MSLFVKVFTNFYSHRKTIRLRAALGDDAYWIPPRLWAYAAENQPDGDFSSYSAAEIGVLLGYSKDASSMLQALLQAGFLDSDMRIHDWAEHNSYHKVFADRARKAAKAKWEKERTKEKETDTERRGEETSIASSMLQASNGSHKNGGSTTSPRFPKDFQILISTAEQEKERLKNKGAHISATGTEWHDDKARQEFLALCGKVKAWKKQLLAMG